jgi:hypothetical protein
MPDHKHPPGPPMALVNMRQGVHHVIAFGHNDACRHQATIDVSKYPDDVEVRGSSVVSNAASTVGAGVGSTCGPTGQRNRRGRPGCGTIETMARWSVDLIRMRMKRLGTVVAANDADPIKKRWRFFVALGHAFHLTWPVYQMRQPAASIPCRPAGV